MKNIKKLVSDFCNITTAQDLKREKLSMSDFSALSFTLQDLQDTGITNILSINVKNWLERRGLNIRAHGVGWMVTL